MDEVQCVLWSLLFDTFERNKDNLIIISKMLRIKKVTPSKKSCLDESYQDIKFAKNICYTKNRNTDKDGNTVSHKKYNL